MSHLGGWGWGMLKYPTLTFSKWDFIAGLKYFLVSETYYPLLKRGGWKSWKQNKTVWNCRNKMFHFNMIQNISGELPFWQFYPFRNPKTICKYPFPILLWWLREKVMKCNPECSLQKSCQSHSSLCMEHLVLTSQVLSDIFFPNTRGCRHWVSWHRITSEAFLPQVILLGK